MSPIEYSGPVNIFFVVHQRIPFVRREYNNLHAKIQELHTMSTYPVKAWLLLMGDAALALEWPWQGASLIRSEPKCDLGTAARRVNDLLRRHPAGKSLVVIWSMDGLGGDWRPPMTEMVTLPGVNVVVMAYQVSHPEDGAYLRNLRSCKYLERIADDFAKCIDMLLADFHKRGVAQALPAAALPQAATMVMPREAPPTPPALPPTFDELDTVPDPAQRPVEDFPTALTPDSQAVLPDPLPQQPGSELPEAQTAPMPTPPQAGEITEYPDLSNGRLDEMMGQHADPKTEAQTLPKPEQAAENASPAQPNADPQIVIEIAEVQAKPVKLEKTPEPKPKPEVEPTPPPTNNDAAGNLWAELEPTDPSDRFDHIAKKKFKTPDGWMMVAASRRGKMHAHKALYREDAFALGEAVGWHFVVVADGGGSRPLARVGSNLSAEVAVNTMCELARKLEISELTPEETCRELLEKGMRRAYEALQQEAAKRSVKLDDFGTTFLAMAHRFQAGQKRHLVGVLQVGDGLIAAQLADKSVQVLANADVGESASQTLFLTSHPWKDWLDRIQLLELETEPLMFVSMCDGVSDDLIPYPRNLPRMFDFMQEIALKDAAEEALLEFLKYEKRGSFDDRTLVLLFREPTAPPAALKDPSAMVRQMGQFGEAAPTSTPADLPTGNHPD